ncbi:MAG: IS30 family transposase [Patescibacteria group bacterium]
MVERVTRYVMVARLTDKKPKTTRDVLLKRLQEQQVKSITFDNGVENRDHQEVASKLNVKTYFCHPYSSWEKGTNENVNGMVRRYLPRDTDLSTVSDQELKAIENELNSRPRKILGYRTPQELLEYYYKFALAN